VYFDLVLGHVLDCWRIRRSIYYEHRIGAAIMMGGK